MPLSGREILVLYLKSGWRIARQKGRHVQIKKNNLNQTIPMRKELKKGT